MKKGKISLITIYTLAILMLIVFGGKGLISYISNQTSAVLAAAEVGDSNDANLSKEQILNQLSSVLHTKEGNGSDSTMSILYSTLEEFLIQENVKLTKAQAETIIQRIEKLSEVVQSESVSEVSQMSLGGKLVFLKEMEEIYHTCGFQLLYNLKGNIYGIANKEGKTVYYKDTQTKWSIPFAQLINLFLICGTLVVIAYLVARKNNYRIRSEAWNMLHIGKKEWKKA